MKNLFPKKNVRLTPTNGKISGKIFHEKLWGCF